MPTKTERTRETWTHHCDVCGEQVAEFCAAHPKATVLTTRGQTQAAPKGPRLTADVLETLRSTLAGDEGIKRSETAEALAWVDAASARLNDPPPRNGIKQTRKQLARDRISLLRDVLNMEARITAAEEWAKSADFDAHVEHHGWGAAVTEIFKRIDGE